MTINVPDRDEPDATIGTIPAALAAAAAGFGDQEAVVDGDVRLTYADLLDRANQFGAAVVASGLQAGDRAAIWAPNSHHWIVAALGLLQAGAILVPVNTRFKGDEAAYILERSGARLLVVENDFLGIDYLAMLGGCAGVGSPISSLPEVVAVVDVGSAPPDGAVGWDRFMIRGGPADLVETHTRAAAVTSSDISDIMFTSGTTGRPKGAMCGHGQNITVNTAWSQTVGLRRGDRYLAVNPFFNSFGYKAGVLASLITGATILPLATFDVARVMELIERESVSVLPGPPTIYSTILDHPNRDDYDLSSARLAVTGAAVVPVALIERMREELTFTTILTAYGLTETCGTATVSPLDADPYTVATTAGKPLPGTEVKIVDETGAEAATDAPGEVLVRGYNVMQGYFSDPLATAEAIDKDGWLRTGDVGTVDSRGFLRITDRIKDMFVVGGFNAYPAEIEQVLMRHPDVLEVAVIGVPDQRLGETGRAFVVPRSGHTPSEASLIDFCKEHLANFKVPSSVVLIPALPRNAGGKVLKIELRQSVALGTT